MNIPRSEYPRPQMVREDWINLNGDWEFEIDYGRSGCERELHAAEKLSGNIVVPFCPESKLSGVAHTDFIPAAWYRRSFMLPESWHGKRVLLNFGAVDYETEVWINGETAGSHRGGYTPFTIDITKYLKSGSNIITVCAEDDTRSPLQPTGKQSKRYASYACLYTRTTGIWQTVWMEAVPDSYMLRPKITPDLENGMVYVEVPLEGQGNGLMLHIEATLNGDSVGTASVYPNGHLFRIALPLSQIQPWSPDNPVLYDLTLTLWNKHEPIDIITSYFGLRSIRWDGPAILINGKPVFQRLILDQGFNPDGIYTAPSDDELRADIERSQAMGFNGARLHQKVFEERFLYWADKLGYLVWGEMPDWGLDLNNGLALDRFLTEWREVLARDYNHPALIGWCPFNETWGGVFTDVLQQVYKLTKQIDPTRPAIDTSGNYHVGTTDIYDCHDYDQNPETFALRYEPFANGEIPHCHFPDKDAPYNGQPYFISEYGGIWWNPGQIDTDSWGYGNRPQSEEEFLHRFKGLTETLLNHPRMCGFCYTQLTDVELEVNGLYTYDRSAKFDPELIKAIVSQPAAIETSELGKILDEFMLS
ncbi:MAG: glycoside hydrolase family 2 protein [Armatimonadota bacterium]